MTPREFEKAVAAYLKRLSRRSRAHWHVTHDELLPGAEGDYQIDVTARFSMNGFQFVLLVECKHQRSPIKRDQVQTLDFKVRSVGAHKGAVFSTAPFQSGALAYAKRHGMALVQCLPSTETIFVVSGAADFGGEGPSQSSPWLAEPIEWRFFWNGEEFSAEHWSAPELLTGFPFAQEPPA